ncbi:hypothetical protein G9A89_003443 [Geosiphon pyriformis]|nr:hypothetical protein G9A89_003443 [Geosiphon pyriformis]
MPLFSKAVLKSKPITVMYTNVKVDDQLSYQVDHTTSARIITADRMTKTPIGKIDNFSFEVNSIIASIKVLVIEATYVQLEHVGAAIQLERLTHLSTLPNEILEIKNNSLEPVETVFISNSDAFLNIKNDPEEFHKHYQNLAPTRQEQEQYLEQLNTQLYSDYWQVAMKPEDKKKTVFIIREENFKFEVIPFSLTNIPAIFQ